MSVLTRKFHIMWIYILRMNPRTFLDRRDFWRNWDRQWTLNQCVSYLFDLLSTGSPSFESGMWLVQNLMEKINLKGGFLFSKADWQDFSGKISAISLSWQTNITCSFSKNAAWWVAGHILILLLPFISRHPIHYHLFWADDGTIKSGSCCRGYMQILSLNPAFHLGTSALCQLRDCWQCL